MRYSKYPSYRDSGVEWLGEIPEHWKVYRTMDISTLINGFPFDSNKFDVENGTPLVRIRDINKRVTAVRFNGIVPRVAEISNDDILIGMDGDFNVSWWGGGNAALNQRVACVRTQSKKFQRFIYYALPFNMQLINDLTYYTTVKHLSSNDILKTRLALPSESEILKIANYLDIATAKIDTLIEKQTKLIELLKEKRQVVISTAVNRGLDSTVAMKDSGIEWLGEIPEHWDVKKFKYNARIQGGKDQKEVLDDNGEYPVYGSGGIFGYANKYLYNGESVLFGRKGTVDKPLYVQGSFWTVDTMYYTILESITVPKWFYYSATTIRFDYYQYGSAVPSMTQEDLHNIYFSTPSKEEQQKIINYLDEKTSKIDNLITKATKAIDLLKEKRTALISSAVTGKIDVRNAS